MSILLNGGSDNLGTVLSSVTLILKKELINLKSRSTTNLSLFFYSSYIDVPHERKNNGELWDKKLFQSSSST